MTQSSVDGFSLELNQWCKAKLVSSFSTVSREDLCCNGVIVYGISIQGKSTVASLLQTGIVPDWIIDKNIKLVGQEYAGIKIRHIDSLKETGSRFIILASTHIAEMINICDYYQTKWILNYAIRDFCPLVPDWGITSVQNLPHNEILNTYHLFADNKSLQIYMRFIKYHYTYFNDFSDIHDPIDYFPSDLKSRIDYSHFVDCGACDGDTLNLWLSNFNADGNNCSYYAIEPNWASFCKLQAQISKLPKSISSYINAYNCGVADRSYEVRLNQSSGIGAGFKISPYSVAEIDTAEQNRITINRIDDLLIETKPTIIKADVEGFEMALLNGAARTIKKYRPTLAISVYHKCSDIWKIPSWINNLNLNYDIYLRHQPTVFTDTTCYAIPR